MNTLLWPLVLVVTFLIGLAAGTAGPGRSAVHEADGLRLTVSRLEQQVGTLQARLRARDEDGGTGHGVSMGRGARGPLGASSGEGMGGPGHLAPGAAPGEVALDAGARREPWPAGSPDARGTSPGRANATAGPRPTLEAALDLFYRYLAATNGSDGGERRPRTREMLAELRAMGDVGAEALLQVLGAGSDSEERRTAARLLGMLQAPQALPLLHDILATEDDVLLRRAAASALGRLQTPESVSAMEGLLASPGEDRFVRMSAAYGLAQAGSANGVAALMTIFDEANSDGRGRDLAFRSLASMNDGRSLPFMRHLVTSRVEPAYRLQAMRFVAAQGDRQSLGALQQVMQSPAEQASIRDAAAQAYRSISSR